MPSLISGCSLRRTDRVGLITCFVPVLLGLAGMAAGVCAEPWRWRPWLTFSTGYENDRILDPNLERFAVPGGGFLDVSPGATLSLRFKNGARLSMAGQGTLERFLNDRRRSLYSAALEGDLRIPLRSSWRWRTTLGGDAFADSERESVNRAAGGLETAIRYVRSRYYLELLGGAQGRRYWNLIVADEAGLLGTYTEASVFLGAGGSARAMKSLVLSSEATWRKTDSRDVSYDATTLSFQASARTMVSDKLWISINGLGQRRHFESRHASDDTDSYWQLGAGLEREIGGGLLLNVRYAYAKYSEEFGDAENIHRLSSGITWRLGRAQAVPALNEASLTLKGDEPPIRRNDLQIFRLYAPEAEHVAVVADFNGWDSTQHPLLRAENGWWELELRLPAGSYQYAYVVDGSIVPPPDAKVTVDDGFGGKNGLLRVAPNDL